MSTAGLTTAHSPEPAPLKMEVTKPKMNLAMAGLHVASIILAIVYMACAIAVKVMYDSGYFPSFPIALSAVVSQYSSKPSSPPTR